MVYDGHVVVQLVKDLCYKLETSQVLITSGVIGIFHWLNPSGCNLALGSTKPLPKMSTRDISWGLKAVGV